MKKFTALLLTVLMLASLSVTAFAGPGKDDPVPGDIIITNSSSSHTYLAYEILAGNITIDDTTKLAKMDNPWWGCNITDDGIKALLNHYGISYTETEGDKYFRNDNRAAALATEISGSGAAGAKEFAAVVMSDPSYYAENGKTVEFASTGSSATLDVHHQGYYVVVDKPDSLNGKVDSAYTDYIVVVVADKDVTVEHKNEVPVLIKKVQENTELRVDKIDPRLPKQELPANYNDTADYSIGDKIPYELVASVPGSLDRYNTYKMVFNDTMNGMKYVAESMKVFVLHTSGRVELASSAFERSVSTDSKTIAATLNMTRNTAGAFELALKDGGTTTVDAGSYIIVTYEAQLTDEAQIGAAGNRNTAYLQYSNNPTKEGDLGQTTSDENIVYTYALDLQKINAEDKSPLANAEFVIQKTTGGAADPAGYAILEKVEAQLPADAPAGTVPAVLGYRVTGWGTLENATKVKTDAEGKIHFIGLDKGHYFVTETNAPTNYSKLQNPIEIAINSNINHTQSWNGASTLTNLEVSVTDPNKMTSAINNGAGNITTGTVGINVANNATAQLPTTGGVGTTLFYVIGSALALGAALVLVVKRRMSVEGK